MKDKKDKVQTAPAAPMESEESINENYSARPKNIGYADETPENADMTTSSVDYGEMNLQDAKDSGYTDESGHAISMSKKDKPGHPTGAYTDIGAGRSSAVVTRDEFRNHHH